MPVARRLEQLILDAWPHLSAPESPDRVDILVGIRTPTDVDLLVLIDLLQPHAIPLRPRGVAASEESFVQRAAIAIEVKQLAFERFTVLGNQLFPCYGSKPERTSVAAQACHAARGVAAFARQSGADLFVYALAWLPQVDESCLTTIESCIVGAQATWFSILAAAAQQCPFELYGGREAEAAIPVLRQRLLNRRVESARDRERVDRLSRHLATQSVVDRLVQLAGRAQIRLHGRGGSGKTTALALLAVRLAEVGARVLILTFHRTLRADIEHLIRSLARRTGIRDGQIHVETTVGFLLSVLQALNVEPPSLQDGQVDYVELDAAFGEAASLIVRSDDGSPDDLARLCAQNRERFAWDYIFIDETQDWTDAERDLLRALYGHRRLILADGVDQLVRRQIACDWNLGVPAEERVLHHLGDSLRMLRNVASFVNSFARVMGFDSWRIVPSAELPGGRVLVVTGDAATPGFMRAIVGALRSGRADAVDALLCVPPTRSDLPAPQVRARVLEACREAAIPVWDGTNPAARGEGAGARDALRLVSYDSCRGLEGWVTVAFELDELARAKRKYPNQHPGDPEVERELVAQRWLLIPLTRAVHTLVITLRNPDCALADALREAADDPDVGGGVVEWVTADEAALHLEPRDPIT